MGLRSHARCHPYPIPQPVKVDHSTGVYNPNYEDTRPGTIHRFAGKVLSSNGEMATIAVRNKIVSGQEVEVVTRTGANRRDLVKAITDKRGNTIEAAQPNTQATLTLEGPCEPMDLIRIAEESTYGHTLSRLPKQDTP